MKAILKLLRFASSIVVLSVLLACTQQGDTRLEEQDLERNVWAIVDEANGQIERLREQAHMARTEEVRTLLDERVRELQRLRDEARFNLDQLQKAAADRVAQIRSDLDQALRELRSAIRESQRTLSAVGQP